MASGGMPEMPASPLRTSRNPAAAQKVTAPPTNRHARACRGCCIATSRITSAATHKATTYAMAPVAPVANEPVTLSTRTNPATNVAADRMRDGSVMPAL
ncbi:MAG: hypothetical protein GYA65_15495 [Actinobacteria bacterium]|nr:hypothetical protein [Actinomycetota bacterium]